MRKALEELADAVEDEVGMGHMAWDMVTRSELMRAALVKSGFQDLRMSLQGFVTAMEVGLSVELACEWAKEAIAKTEAIATAIEGRS